MQATTVKAATPRFSLSSVSLVAIGAALLGTCFALSTAAADSKAKHAGVGDPMPTASLVDTAGKKFDLARAWDQRPAIVVFYRGHW